MRVLLVEDEHRIAQAIKEGLEEEGYAVDVAYDGEAGYVAASSEEYDLIVLDVVMPLMSGPEVVKKIREDGKHTPIIMLTAKNQDKDIVTSLDSGADDYLAKPFAFDMLLARIKALLRRPDQSIGEVLKVGDLVLDPANKQVSRENQEIALSAKEFAILEYMMRNPGRIVSKDNIIAHVWDFDANVLPNNVEVFINLIRAKIDKPFDTKLLHTVRGFGYKVSENK